MSDTPENNDIERLFRDNDDVGADSSLLLRPLRQLFKKGKPVGDIMMLTVSPTGDVKFPFGMLTETKRARLVFWPILPSGVSVVCAGEEIEGLDHITLEFPSEKIHLTAYDAKGQSSHIKRGWKMQHLSCCPLGVWFRQMFRVSLLSEQDTAVQRRVHIPTTDADRRLNEFVGNGGNIHLWDVPLPPADAVGDFIYLGVSLDDEPKATCQITPAVLPADTSLNSVIEGWPEGHEFQIMPSRRMFGQRSICVATACPPGRLLSDVCIGLPRAPS